MSKEADINLPFSWITGKLLLNGLTGCCMYANVIIDISHKDLDKFFQYRIPESLEGDIRVGDRVDIPFGRYNSTRSGYVVEITDKADFEESKIKDIKGHKKGSISIDGKLIGLASWIHERYGSTMSAALSAVSPVKRSVGRKKLRIPSDELIPETEPVQELNEAQKEVYSAVKEDIDKRNGTAFLLYGVTGSGKTEVYIKAAEEALSQGRQVIILIPEISLTFQTVSRFRAVFKDRISVLHSKLSEGEKYREFEKARSGETSIMIGPRSAIFAPFNDIGLIVVDEEHDTAYKSDMAPKYDAVEVAAERARVDKATLLLGSATPSVSSYFNAKAGVYKMLRLPERTFGRPLAEITLVDMREEYRSGNKGLLSNELSKRMEEAFNSGEQVMLFLNRRGYNSFISCRSCGEVIKCPNCDVSLSYHKSGILQCHYCGYQITHPNVCPSCSSPFIAGFGIGTEKVEEEIAKAFPDIKILRMDKDTTVRKNAQAEILNTFREKKADCLIGTQMIVKGHDFENVTLVGAINADMGLFSNDYRSAERTFDLLVQASGRAGRGDKKGHVVIQTYQPEHYALIASGKQDYELFYNTETAYRKLAGYPPYVNMFSMMIVSVDEGLASGFASELVTVLRKVEQEKNRPTQIIGPAEADIKKINNEYRYMLYAKAPKGQSLTMLEDNAKLYLAKRYPDSDIRIVCEYETH